MRWILVPTFNEEANLPNLALDLAPYTQRDDTWLVIADDGSTDRTRELVPQLFPGARTVVLGDRVNRGPGHAFAIGFDWILHRAADDDLVITMEADCTSDIAILPRMLALTDEGHDLVLASVYVQGGGFERTTWLRKLFSAAANSIYRSVFDLQVSTLSSFYRVHRVALLRKAAKQWPKLIEEPGFICMPELLIKLTRAGASVIEVPMVLASNKRIGPSRMQLTRTALHYVRFLWRFRSGRRRPMWNEQNA